MVTIHDIPLARLVAREILAMWNHGMSTRLPSYVASSCRAAYPPEAYDRVLSLAAKLKHKSNRRLLFRCAYGKDSDDALCQIFNTRQESF